jgi:DNA-binding transcriptional regulator YdaS (Cro superfamily)
MRLHDYIKENGVKDLAEKIPANPMYLRQIGWGKARPSLTMAKKIIEATDGKVTFDDLIQSI